MATYASAMTSVDGSNTFSCSSAAWTTNQYTASPNLVRIKSGSQTGRFFLVTANTATQITVNNGVYNLQTILSGTDNFEIVPANTLATLFGTGTGSSPAVPFLTSSSSSTADNIFVWNGTGWDTYFNNGTNWYKTSSLNNQNNTIIYPDEAVFVLRRATSTLPLIFQGVVPTTAEITDVFGPGATFISNRFPVDLTLASLGLSSLPNWQAGSSASQADDVFVWNGTGWDTYFFNGTHWMKSSSLSTQDSQPIPTNSGVFIKRLSNTSGTNSSLIQLLPYSL